MYYSLALHTIIDWTFLASLPIEVEAHTVPHFKAPVNCEVDGLGQEHAGTFT